MNSSPKSWGVQAVDALLRRTKLLGAATSVGLLVGCVFGVLEPRPYIAEARVEVGTRFLDGWLMHPLAAGERLAALGQAHPSWAPDVALSVTTTRRRGTNEVTRFMTFSVAASTASTAQTLRDYATKRWVTEHEQFVLHDRDALERQKDGLTQLQSKLQATDIFDSAVALAHVARLLRGTNSTLSPTRLFNSRVLVNRPVHQRPRRLLIFAITGAAAGLLLALTSIVFGGTEEDGDPIITAFFRLSRRYAPLISCVVVVVTAGALALAMAKPLGWTGVSVIEPAVVEDRPIAEVDALAESLRQSVPNVLSQRIPETGRLGVQVIRDQPPQNPQINLLKGHASDASAKVVKALLLEFQRQVVERQSSIVDAERVRLSQDRRNLDASILRLSEGELTPASADAWGTGLIERARLDLALNTVRTHPPLELQPPALRPSSRRQTIIVTVMAGLAGGLALGYAFAFLFAGVRARSRRDNG